MHHRIEIAATASLIAATLCACPEDAAGSGGGHAAAPEGTQAAEPGAAPPSVPPAADPSLDEGRVRALFDTWLGAQNQGDFEAYAGTYASRFEGVKRSGLRTYRFDREGWLADRRRMFHRPMHVVASELGIARSRASAVVSFRQRWSSGTYSDEGRKQLVVVKQGEALRIAREEMLRSAIIAHGAPAPPALDLLMLVTHVAGAAHVVLSAAPEESWAAGPIRLGDRGTPAVALRRATLADLPPALRSWTRRAVRLYGPRGPVCTGTVGELRVIHRVVPHFSVRAQWRGEAGGAPMPPVAIARDVWELGEEAGALLAGVVIPDAGAGCEEALWARDASQHPPLIFRPGAPPPAVSRALLRRLRALPAYGRVRRDYLDYPEDPRDAPWDAFEGASPVLSRWRGGGRTLVAVTARAGSGCAEFGGSLWALFEIGAGEPTLLTSDDDPGAFTPLAVLDVDGDGLVEVVVHDALLRASAGGLAPVLCIGPAQLDCGC